LVSVADFATLPFMPVAVSLQSHASSAAHGIADVIAINRPALLLARSKYGRGNAVVVDDAAMNVVFRLFLRAFSRVSMKVVRDRSRVWTTQRLTA
jgi:hypothetical protein